MSKLWYPFTAMKDWSSEEQLSIVGGQGNYLIASNGKRYLDGVSSLWTNVHGHNHPTLSDAIKAQVDRISHSTLLGLENPLAEELAERLVEITPAGLNHVFYSDSGSTAVEIALKQAFQYWQLVGNPEKTEFIHLDEAYHGDTLGAVSVGGIDVFHQVFGPLLLDTLSIPCPNGHKTGRTQSEAEAHSLAALQQILEAKASQVAALIVEPLVQGAGGILTHSPDYLAKLAAYCKQYDVLLILDEVATGFGRTGSLFAADLANVQPDFLCLAKGITGGYLPLAATLSSSRIFEAFLAPRKEGKTFFHGHTYTGNPLACAAALANLRVFKDEETMENLPAKIAHLTSRLEKLVGHENVSNVRQQGFMVGVELCSSDGSPLSGEAFIGDRVCQAAREHGVIIRNLSDVIVLMPPLSITIDQLDQLTHALSQAISAVVP